MNILSFNPTSPNVISSLCNGVLVIGGETIFHKDLIVNVSLNQIPPHDSILINFRTFALGTWNESDKLIIS